MGLDRSLKANIRCIVTDITLCKEGQKRGMKGKNIKENRTMLVLRYNATPGIELSFPATIPLLCSVTVHILLHHIHYDREEK